MISFSKPYKIHSAFSCFDVADIYLDRPHISAALGLPTTSEDMQVRFYSTLATVAEKALDELSAKPAQSIDGAIAELVVLAYLRDSIIATGSSHLLAVRQAFINQDFGKASLIRGDEKHKAALSKLPSFSYDLLVAQRDGSGNMKVEVKKSTDGARGLLVNDVIRVILHKKEQQKDDFLKNVRRFALSQAKRWRGKPLSEEDITVIESMYKKLDFRGTVRNFNEKMGREILRLASSKNGVDQAF